MGGINKRDHLIKTGQELIWAKGYDFCSIKDITTQAGLPKGSFYHYFESKEKFALEAMNTYIEDSNEQFPDQNKDLKTLEKLIDARINSIIQIQFAKECYMSVMVHAYSDQDESFRAEVLQAIDKSNSTMVALMTQLQNRGLINSSLDLVELNEFIDFAWRGARLKTRITKSEAPLRIFKKYLLEHVLKP